MRFAHLHVHSHYSLLEGLPSIKKLIARSKEQGSEALALTDNGSMYGIIELVKKCKDENIKPIVGVDAYLAPNKMTDKRPRIDDRPHRIVLLARNGVGYKNLVRLSTLSYIEGFYYKPRLDHELLAKYSEGLIALSGSTKGVIPELLREHDEEKALEKLRDYQKMFGPDGFYLELIHHPDFPEQQETNALLIDFAKKYGAPLVATKNVFYLKPDDDEAYQTLLCIQKGKTLEEHKRTSLIDVDLSMSDPKEIAEAFKDVPEAIANVEKIIDLCNVEIELGKNYLPVYKLPEDKNDNDFLYELCELGFKDRYPEVTPEIRERFEYEFGIIKKMGFASYFLIVQDFVNWAKNEGILVGPGRGSAAGSIVSYLLKITDLDPLRYGLLFERFLNPDRVSIPDIDMDFADKRRAEVMQYVKSKYGTDHVAGIITFGTMAPKAAVRDAARVLGLTFDDTSKIAKLVPDPTQGKYAPLTESIKGGAPELTTLYNNDPRAKRVLDLAVKIVGTPRHASQHACGIVISDVPLIERVPLQQSQHEDVDFVTQYSLATVEYAGMVKMDFLGLSNLSVIQDALDIIEAVHHEKIEMSKLPLDDKATFDLLGRGETTGVFQLECLSGDTLISNTTIKKLYEKRHKNVLEAVYLDEGKVHKTIIEGVFASGKKKVYSVIAENGWYVKTTLDHHFLTEQGWRELREIKPGDKILMKTKARHLLYNCCQACEKQIDGQKEGRSKFCYSCSARHYRNPSKEISRQKIKASRDRFYAEGGKPWNAGLIAETNETLRATGLKIAKALEGRTLEEKVGRERAAELRAQASRRMAGAGNHMFGRPSHHRNGGFRPDLGHYVRSSWEADFARILRLHQLEYQYEPQTFALQRQNGEVLHYTPDFFVPSENAYYEIKGWMHDLDAEKIALFGEQYPSCRLVLISATKFAEFAVAYRDLVAWECPKIPEGFAFVSVQEIIPGGEEETYDIKMRSPGNNFVANGFVVHNSDGMKRYIRELQPTVFEDIIAMVALYRPGPMQFIESFINRKHGKERIVYEHKLMENSMRNTYGIPVYQEQVMQLSKDMAGFTGGEADTLRKAMGKKIADLMAKMKEKFIEGSVQKGVDKKIATTVFEKLEAFAAYGFNKSHAACYALIAYWTAYLKAHYPNCFMAALMNSDSGLIDRIAIEITECKELGLEVLPPDVNESFPGFAVVPGTNKIRFGLGAIKNIGEEVAKEIVSERKRGGEYKNLEDFSLRLSSKHFNKKVLESLTKCGALDRYADRGVLMANVDNILSFHKFAVEAPKNQDSLFASTDFGKAKLVLVAAPVAPKSEKLAWERELLGLYISSHPYAEFAPMFEKITVPCGQLGQATGKFLYIGGLIADMKQITTKKGDPMAFLTLGDSGGYSEVIVFPTVYKQFRACLEIGATVVVSGRRDTGEDGVHKVLASSIYRLTEKTAESIARALVGGMPIVQDLASFESSSVTVVVPEVTPSNALTNLKTIFQRNPGSTRVYLLMKKGGIEQKIETSFMIDWKNEVEKEIIKALGILSKVIKN
ncbi:MAG: DNA polymerase III subunit alpha [bacterium]